VKFELVDRLANGYLSLDLRHILLIIATQLVCGIDVIMKDF